LGQKNGLQGEKTPKGRAAVPTEDANSSHWCAEVDKSGGMGPLVPKEKCQRNQLTEAKTGSSMPVWLSLSSERILN